MDFMAVKDLSAFPSILRSAFSESMIQDDTRITISWNVVYFSAMNLEFGQLQPGFL
jgi:hypothetical protein